MVQSWLILLLGLLLSANVAATLFYPRLLRGAAPNAMASSLNASLVDRRERRLKSPSIGTFKTLVLLVRFTDHESKELPPRDHFQTMCESQIKAYFAEQSYGQYTMECDVRDWVTTDNTEAHYAGGVAGWRGADEGAGFFIPILNQLDASGMDWKPFDVDMNGDLDSVLVIHSGFASEQGVGADCGAADPSNRIYSQGHAGSMAWTSANYETYLSGYAVTSAFLRLCPGSPASFGIAAHELVHTLEAPDLYHLGEGGGALGGIGLYDLMSNSFGPAGDGNVASMSAFVKKTVGWLTPTEITVDGTYSIGLLLNKAEAYIIRKGYAANEYLLIENRGNANRDTGLPGSGLLIYHVDEAVPIQDTPGFPGQDGWPTNGLHFRVALLQADGKYDLEQFANNGDAGDYWVSGMTLGPGNGQTYPNTDAYQGGIIVSTGITITDISAAGDTMTFRVAGLGTNPDGSTATADPAAAATPTTPSPTASMGGVIITGDTVPPASAPPGSAPPTAPIGGVVITGPDTPDSGGMVVTTSPAPTPQGTGASVSLGSPPPTSPPPSTPPPSSGPPSTPPPTSGPPSTSPPGNATSTPGTNETIAPTSGGATSNATMAPTLSETTIETNETDTSNNETSSATNETATNMDVNGTSVATNETETNANETAAAPVNETTPIDPSDVQDRTASAATKMTTVFGTVAAIVLLLASF